MNPRFRFSDAWLAGFFDGDACFKAYFHSQSGIPQLEITIKQPSCRALIRGLQREVGVTVVGGMDCKVAGAAAVRRLLNRIGPFLVKKREQHAAAIRFLNVKAARVGRSFTTAQIRQLERLTTQIQTLHHSD